VFETSAVVQITDEKCVGCQRCVNVCPSDALAMNGRLAVLDQPKCVGLLQMRRGLLPLQRSLDNRGSPSQDTHRSKDDYEQPSVDEHCGVFPLNESIQF
jgi:Fe-S-cluster-containing hydrogenase component 2